MLICAVLCCKFVKHAFLFERLEQAYMEFGRPFSMIRNSVNQSCTGTSDNVTDVWVDYFISKIRRLELEVHGVVISL